MKETMQQIRKVLGEIPILASEQRLLEAAEAEAQAAEDAAAAAQPNGSSSSSNTPSKPKSSSTTKVLADGTYATETAYSSNAAHQDKLDKVKNAQKPPLRALILGGDYYTATVLAATLTKIVLRFAQGSRESQAVNALRAEVRSHIILYRAIS